MIIQFFRVFTNTMADHPHETEAAADDDESDYGSFPRVCEACGRSEYEIDVLDVCDTCGGVCTEERVTLSDGTSAEMYCCSDPIGCGEKVSRRRSAYYCEECWVATFEDDARKHQEMLDDVDTRRAALVSALAARGCVLRANCATRLCGRYIRRGEFVSKEYNSVDKIAERMAQIRWLHECMAEKYKESLNTFEYAFEATLNAGYILNIEPRDAAEFDVKKQEGGWPAVWPWRRHLMFMGLLRWIPMLMLRRKQATERLYHPKRMRLEGPTAGGEAWTLQFPVNEPSTTLKKSHDI